MPKYAPDKNPDGTARPLREFVHELRARLSLFVIYTSFTTTCAYIDGYRRGSCDDDWILDFRDWMVARGKARPELYWPWLVLCELYPENALPNARHFTPEQDEAALGVLFDMLEEFFAADAAVS